MGVSVDLPTFVLTFRPIMDRSSSTVCSAFRRRFLSWCAKMMSSSQPITLTPILRHFLMSGFRNFVHAHGACDKPNGSVLICQTLPSKTNRWYFLSSSLRRMLQ